MCEYSFKQQIVQRKLKVKRNLCSSRGQYCQPYNVNLYFSNHSECMMCISIDLFQEENQPTSFDSSILASLRRRKLSGDAGRKAPLTGVVVFNRAMSRCLRFPPVPIFTLVDFCQDFVIELFVFFNNDSYANLSQFCVSFSFP